MLLNFLLNYAAASYNFIIIIIKLWQWPWNKHSLHPTILLRFEAAILRWDVLDQVLLLLPANLGNGFQLKVSKIGHLCSRLELTVGWGTNLPGKIIVNIQISFFLKFKPILRNLTNLGILRQAVSGFTFFTFFFSRVHWRPEEIRYELKLSLYLWELSMIFVRVINNICERILVWLPSGPASPRTPVPGKERLAAPNYEGGLKGW